MEQWSARDDSPYVRRPEPSSSPWWLWVLMIVLLGAGAGYYFWQQDRPLVSQQPEPIAVPEPRAEAAPKEEEPAVRYPVPAAAEESPARPLPTLEASDPMMRESASGLVGRKAFEAMVRPTQLIRNVVATVDNLPRETAPTRVMPLEPVPGRFTPEAGNTARYTPYVRVLESLNTRALVQRYIEAYPLFQQAYAELGFPNRNFNDRLVQAIDNLLAAPELAAPPELVQPKVLYEFADEDLQKRSAGQKIMMRIGADNARRVKAKLREIRRELVAQR